MNSQGAISPEVAVTVYELADTLTQLWYYAEHWWFNAEPDGPLPDRVDVPVGQTLLKVEALTHHAEVASSAEALGRSVSAAWDQYRAAWQGQQHLETLEQLQKVDSDFRYEAERNMLDQSPLASPAWTALKGATTALQESLPPVLLICFQLSSLLAAELYRNDERNQRFDQLDVTERRYLTVTVNQELSRFMGTLVQNFSQLAELEYNLSRNTVTRAMERIDWLHRTIPRLLQAQPTSGSEPDRSANTVLETPSAGDSNITETLIFVPGAFTYRNHQEPLTGKAWQVLEALYLAPGRIMTLRDMRNKIWCDVVIGNETIRSAVQKAREALRGAIRVAGIEGPEDPIPCVERSRGRTAWRLDLQ